MTSAALDRDRWPALADALAAWLPSQRWYQGKARRLSGVEILDSIALPPAAGYERHPAVTDVLAKVHYPDGGGEQYQVPVVVQPDAPASGLIGAWDDGHLVDALHTDAGCQALVRAVMDGSSQPTAVGATVTGQPVEPLPGAPGPARRMTAEQSNSSVVFGGTSIMKLFRRVEPGVNPDAEITAALTRQGFPHVPTQHGTLARSDSGASTVLAVLSAFVGDATEGWAAALADVAGGQQALIDPVRELGAVVGALHRCLAEAFDTGPVTAATRAGWQERMTNDARRVLALAREHAPQLTAPVTAAADEVLAAFGRWPEPAAREATIRIHGDLHLGQVLRSRQHGWLVLDFEGEPARTLEERRTPDHPLRDVAGMLRSFDYAAAHAAMTGGEEAVVPDAATRWRTAARTAFQTGYRARAEALLPADPAAAARLTLLFELDKAIYELGYELANRPAWVPIPVGGILRVLDALRSGRP